MHIVRGRVVLMLLINVCNICISKWASGQSNLTKGRIAVWRSGNGVGRHTWALSGESDSIKALYKCQVYFTVITVACGPYSLYLTMSRPYPLKIAPSHGASGPSFNNSSLGQRESITQTSSRSVQPFLQGLRSWQADRPADHATL